MNQEKGIYFSGINGLRFFAALAVIITHIELLKKMYGFPNIWEQPVIFDLGGFGVYFFFVLSGFLITYLLLVEKQKEGTIRIKQFYMRRILRIWPLYYLILVIGFFVLPKIGYIQIEFVRDLFIKDFTPNLLLYLLILPNLAASMFSTVPHIGQTWSIGVEEQFYIFWPWVISKSKKVLRSLLMIISGLILVKVLMLVLGKFYGDTSWYMPLRNFIAMSKFECMAIGGIGAYFVFVKHPFLKVLYNKYVLNLGFLLIPLLIFGTPARLQDGIHIVYSLIFLVIILNVANNSVKIKLENKVLNYLGKISYGIYMYHFMIIPLILCLLVNILGMSASGVFTNIILYAASILLTVGISSLSYELFENRFIKMKSRFSIIKSGEKNN
ncbi:MAG: acyltransferase, partial [Bacteroidota bacterium]